MVRTPIWMRKAASSAGYRGASTKLDLTTLETVALPVKTTHAA